jgi:hypothetical protein
MLRNSFMCVYYIYICVHTQISKYVHMCVEHILLSNVENVFYGHEKVFANTPTNN